MTDGASGRRALLLGCGTFTDRSLAELRSPRHDVDEVKRVLLDPQKCRYTVATEVDCTSQRAERAIEGFFSTARTTDTMNLLYLSCHGVQDRQGRLYFAFADTERDFLGSTAVSADWVRECIYSSRSKATLVLVDCCFSGAFIKGMRARSAGANVETLVQDLPRGTGIAVLTASGETEASFEDADSAVPGPSYFTDALITGISSGAADLNRDGRVTVDELYDYIYDQVTRGPSPQRPRRLGAGEGILVVSDAVATPPSPRAARVYPTGDGVRQTGRPRPALLLARGISGSISFDGQWVVIGKNGVGHAYKSERRYHISQLSGVAGKAATGLHHGFLQVILPGVPPAQVVRFGPQAGRPPFTDDNSVSFAKSANEDVSRLRDALQAAIEAAHVGPAPPSGSVPRQSQGPPSGHAVAPAGNDRSARDHSPSPDSRSEYHRGELDGNRLVDQLPLAALDGLVTAQFDVVRWAAPWRQYWGDLLTRADPATTVPPWLPDLARCLGGHAAPPGSANSTFIPSPAYLTGFCAGAHQAWTGAVTGGLLPADRPTLVQWMARPPQETALAMPLAEATIADLTTARKRLRRAAVTRTTLRVVVWVCTAVFLLMEIAAIGVTVDRGWTDADGRPAADQTTSAIVANLGCSIPLLALCILVVLDIRRSRRRRTPQAVGSDRPPEDADGRA